MNDLTVSLAVLWKIYQSRKIPVLFASGKKHKKNKKNIKKTKKNSKKIIKEKISNKISIHLYNLKKLRRITLSSKESFVRNSCRKRKLKISKRRNLGLRMLVAIGLLTSTYPQVGSTSADNWRYEKLEDRNLKTFEEVIEITAISGTTGHRTLNLVTKPNPAWWMEGSLCSRTLLPSNKDRNRERRSVNGNGMNILKICHWNIALLVRPVKTLST